MNTPIPLACRCGALQGSLRPDPKPNHLVCYCDDCQTAAYALGRPDILDDRGGTIVLQSVPAALQLSPGPLALLRLGPKGLLRWHCGECQTPVANTLANPRLPFVGVVHSFLAIAPADRLARFGPPDGVQGRFARGGTPPGVPARAPFSRIWQTAASLLRGALAGAHQPSPFFDPTTGAPVVAPRVLTREARAAAAAQAAAG